MTTALGLRLLSHKQWKSVCYADPTSTSISNARYAESLHLDMRLRAYMQYRYSYNFNDLFIERGLTQTTLNLYKNIEKTQDIVEQTDISTETEVKTKIFSKLHTDSESSATQIPATQTRQSVTLPTLLLQPQGLLGQQEKDILHELHGRVSFSPRSTLLIEKRQLQEKSQLRHSLLLTITYALELTKPNSPTPGTDAKGRMYPKTVTMSPIDEHQAAEEAGLSHFRHVSMIPSFVASYLATQFLSYRPFQRVADELLTKYIKQLPESVGILVRCSGAFKGASMAMNRWISFGSVPLNTISASVYYHFTAVPTSHGVLGIKVWVFQSNKGIIKTDAE